MPINPNYTRIPDKAEVWIALKANVTDIAAMIPPSPLADLVDLGWEFVGLINDEKGIPLAPSSDVRKYSGFGHRNYRTKIKNGDLESGFTALELGNPTVKKIVLPGSAANKVGMPKDIQVYLLYRVTDEDVAGGDQVWVTLTSAAVQVTGEIVFSEGNEASAEIKVYHTADALGDVFETVDEASDDVLKTVTIGVGTTAYTLTVGGQTTTSLTLKTKAAVQAALRLLSTVIALPDPGVTVAGPDGGPLIATFTATPGSTSASGTGGTVTFT